MLKYSCLCKLLAISALEASMMHTTSQWFINRHPGSLTRQFFIPKFQQIFNLIYNGLLKIKYKIHIIMFCLLDNI
jgi:hypothetical protein